MFSSIIRNKKEKGRGTVPPLAGCPYIGRTDIRVCSHEVRQECLTYRFFVFLLTSSVFPFLQPVRQIHEKLVRSIRLLDHIDPLIPEFAKTVSPCKIQSHHLVD